MTNVLVVSDTHGKYFALEAVLERQSVLEKNYRPTHLIHLGDGVADIDGCAHTEKMCIHTVRGNCDNFFYAYSKGIEKEKLLDICGYKILIMHGDSYSVKSGDSKAIARAAECGADILLYGHTQYATSFTVPSGTEVEGAVLEKDIKVMNPGSLGYDGYFGTIALSDNGILLSHGCIK